MGITLSGRFASVTNYREKGRGEISDRQTGGGSGHRSRGIMVRDFLTGNMTPQQYASDIMTNRDSYGGFNLLLRDVDSFWYCSNRSPDPLPVKPGVHGISNHLLDTDWPKVSRGKDGLGNLLEKGSEIDPEPLFGILQDRTVASDTELPDTGFGIELERMLSPAFIVSSGYGTRSSTIILVDNNGQVTFVERTYGGPDDEGVEGTSNFSLEQG
jgi:uncharacterized protein with NRDE domain